MLAAKSVAYDARAGGALGASAHAHEPAKEPKHEATGVARHASKDAMFFIRVRWRRRSASGARRAARGDVWRRYSSLRTGVTLRRTVCARATRTHAHERARANVRVGIVSVLYRVAERGVVIDGRERSTWST